MEKDTVILSREEYDSLMEMKRGVRSKEHSYTLSYIDSYLGSEIYRREFVVYPKDEIIKRIDRDNQELRDKAVDLSSQLCQFERMSVSEFNKWKKTL